MVSQVDEDYPEWMYTAGQQAILGFDAPSTGGDAVASPARKPMRVLDKESPRYKAGLQAALDCMQEDELLRRNAETETETSPARKPMGLVDKESPGHKAGLRAATLIRDFDPQRLLQSVHGPVKPLSVRCSRCHGSSNQPAAVTRMRTRPTPPLPKN